MEEDERDEIHTPVRASAPSKRLSDSPALGRIMNPAQFARTISEIAARREPFAVASVVRTEGSTLGKPGFKAVVVGEGRIVFGSLGGVCPDGPIIQVALETIKTGTPRLITVHLVDATKAVAGTVRTDNPDEIWVETNCGGSMDIYVEPYLPPHRLVVVAQGGRDEIEDELVHFAKRLGYEVAVIDHLPALTEKPDELIDDPGFDLGKFPFAPTDAVVVLTKGERDVAVLRTLSRKNIAYVGMLASRQRTKENFEELRALKISDDFLGSIHTPVGLDLGGRTPTEIALAIMAEVVAARHGRHFAREA
jgi:xanthine dehydrogenase accessory factor